MQRGKYGGNFALTRTFGTPAVYEIPPENIVFLKKYAEKAEQLRVLIVQNN